MSATNGARLNLPMKAVGSGRELNLGGIGVPALMICFAQETQAGSDAIESVAREKYPTSDDLVVGYVVDLHKVPSLLRKVAEGILGGEHKKAVEGLAPGLPSDDYVVILPDWNGSAVKALGLEDAGRTLGLALIDKAGQVTWRYQGPEPASALREHLGAMLL